jgi:hypothetical protein
MDWRAGMVVVPYSFISAVPWSGGTMHEQHFDALTRAFAIPARQGVSRLLSAGHWACSAGNGRAPGTPAAATTARRANVTGSAARPSAHARTGAYTQAARPSKEGSS